MKILFVRTPRYVWPFHSEKSSFWQPLGFAYMAAVLRDRTSGLTIKIVDCPVLKMGWKSTKAMIAREKPDVLCVGEETVSAHEAIKLFNYTRDILPDTIIITGGPHFSYMLEDTLKRQNVDYVVRFEGEETLLELVQALQKDRKPEHEVLKKIKGIAYLHEGNVISTELRPLVDMEKLPMPAYDLLPMKAYGRGASSHPDLAAVEHSRGCNCTCNFCILWKHMGKQNPATGKIVPCYRTKSPEKAFDEVQHLAEKYKRKTMCWVDASWNTDPRWNERFSDLMIQSGLDVKHSVWMRADHLVRDEKRGIFKKQVKAGVRTTMIGIERTEDKDLAALDKLGYSYATTKKAFEIVRRYPEVLSVATYIYGIPDESKKSMRRFYELLDKIPFDAGLAIPLTPNPGTKYYDDPEISKLIEIKEFKYYNLVNPISRSRHLTRLGLMRNMILNEARVRTRKEQFVGMDTRLQGRRKNATKNLAKGKLRITLRYVKGMLQEGLTGKPYNFCIRPDWYER